MPSIANVLKITSMYEQNCRNRAKSKEPTPNEVASRLFAMLVYPKTNKTEINSELGQSTWATRMGKQILEIFKFRHLRAAIDSPFDYIVSVFSPMDRKLLMDLAPRVHERTERAIADLIVDFVSNIEGDVSPFRLIDEENHGLMQTLKNEKSWLHFNDLLRILCVLETHYRICDGQHAEYKR